MSQKKMLLSLEIKRAMKNLKKLLLGAAIIALVIAIIVLISASLRKEEGVLTRAKVAIVTNNNSVIENIGMDLLDNMETAENMFEFAVTTEEEAMADFEKGVYTGVIIFPNNYIEEIGRGENIPAQVFVKSTKDSFSLGIIAEICNAAGNLLASAEASSYALSDILNENEIKEHKWDMIGDMDVINARVILSRDECIDKRTIVGEGDVSIALGYGCSAIIMLLLLWGLSCGTVLKSDSKVLTKKLEASLIPVRTQIVYKYIALLCLLGSMLGLLFAGIWGSYKWTRNYIALLDIEGPANLLAITLAFVPILLLATALILMCFSLADNQIGGTMLLFIVIIVMCYSSGCLLPNIYLPKAVRVFGSFMPTHFMLNCSTKAALGIIDYQSVLVMLGFTFVFFVISAVATGYKGRRA